MLERLRLTNFKSFVDEAADLSPLTLLVGANASGKSNFLDALRFLQQLSSDRLVSEILDGDEHGWGGLRGGAREAARVDTTSFTLESTWRLPASVDMSLGGEGSSPVTHKIVCQTVPEAKLVYESFGRGPQKALMGAFENLYFPDIQPRRMRSYGKRRLPLGDDANNISGVLARICDDPQEKLTLIEWLAEICAPELADLDFIEVSELGDVMAVIVEKSGRRITARSLSDGTLRFLGLLVALRTAKPGSVILMEEIEADLHPTRIRLLVQYLRAVTREREVQVIATTHSPVVLQWLDEQTLGNAIVFGRVPEQEGTVMRRLRDLPDFFEIAQKKGVEQLFSTGWLERAL